MSNTLELFKSTIRQFLGPVQQFMDDPSVSEILINSPTDIYIERGGKLEKVAAQFPDEEAVRSALNAIAQSVNRRIDEASPRLDARLPDGSRVAAVIPPCSAHTIISIRRFMQKKLSFKDYVKLGAITADGALFLQLCMILGKNVLVSGGTGSGKTTLLSLLCTQIPPGQRIITIEDSKELQMEYEHVVSFETRMADQFGNGEVSIKDLLKSSLRLRPDRIIVGEVRSSEALELINAMNTGHKGCMGTVHANSPEDAIVRLEALAQGGDSGISEKALKYQVASAVEIIVQISRFPDGSRRVGSIAELRGLDQAGAYQVVPLFQMSRLVKLADGKLKGQIEPTGERPSFMQEIIDQRLPFPESKFSKAG